MNGLALLERDLRQLSLDLAADDIGVVGDHRADAAQVNRHVLARHLSGDDRHRRRRGGGRRCRAPARHRERAATGNYDCQNEECG